MTVLVRVGSHLVEAYANWSRWVARCGLCPGAKTLQRFQLVWECELCGTVNEIMWPSEDMVKGVERLLMMRPDPSTRNWLPGETLPELMWENGMHGIFDGLDEALGVAPGDTRNLLSVADDHVQVDGLPKQLPNQDRRRELSA